MATTVLCGVMAWTGAASAAVIASDDFESYTAGSSLVTQSGGTGWTGPWYSGNAGSGATLNNVTAQAPGLPYPDGQREEILGSLNGATAYHQFTTPLADNANDVYYISFDAQNTNGGLRFFGVALFAGTSEQTLIGQGSGQTNWTVGNVDTGGGTKGTIVSTVATTNASHLLVKVTMSGAGTTETLSFWVDPDYTKPITDAANVAARFADEVIWYGSSTALTPTGLPGSVTQIRIGGGTTTTSGGAYSAHWIDNLLVTTDSPFAIPEPASLALIALGVPLVIRRKK
ncbi:MAG: hypothetical protein IT445_11985 [Phycisphaeraceae bacterium]|nr:hypothetical protein [Phycisphaeraceae bacterium]